MGLNCNGTIKLGEECGELITALNKRLACFPERTYWDGKDTIHEIEDEMGDVLASIDYVVRSLGLDKRRIIEREREKLALYEAWDAETTYDLVQVK